MSSVEIIDLEDSRTDYDALDVKFLREWGFTLKDTYKLTMRFYKGKTICFDKFAIWLAEKNFDFYVDKGHNYFHIDWYF